MSSRILLIGAVAAAAFGVVGYSTFSDQGDAAVDYVDFGQVQTPTTPTYRAEVQPPSGARIKEFRIPITHETIEIADGVTYEGWTFGGTVPGPVIRVREGDVVRIHLVNESPMPHSIDFHAARIPWNVAYRSIVPGEEISFEFTARDPGVSLCTAGHRPSRCTSCKACTFRSSWTQRRDGGPMSIGNS